MTVKYTNPLENIKIASPCSQDWDAMIGTERKRFCGECKLNVYNLSGMSRTEAENLLMNSEGRLCVRFFKRADGTILTKDCPVGWQAIKRRVSKISAAAASLVFGVIGGLGFTSSFNQPESVETGRLISVLKTPKPTPTPERERLMGAVAYSSPTPKATPKKDAEVLMGKPSLSRN
ncbi:MAG: hypothetical protein ACR2HG_01960 [Pyrinomonadaceae bacterium]